MGMCVSNYLVLDYCFKGDHLSNSLLPTRGGTEPKFSVSSRAEPKVSRAEPSHEPEIFIFSEPEPSPSQHLVEPSRALIFPSRARAEPRANFADKIF